MKRKLTSCEKTATLQELEEAIKDLANGDGMYQARHYFLVYRFKGGTLSFKNIAGKSFYSKNSSELK